jgi:hypothetical protein
MGSGSSSSNPRDAVSSSGVSSSPPPSPSPPPSDDLDVASSDSDVSTRLDGVKPSSSEPKPARGAAPADDSSLEELSIGGDLPAFHQHTKSSPSSASSSSSMSKAATQRAEKRRNRRLKQRAKAKGGDPDAAWTLEEEDGDVDDDFVDGFEGDDHEDAGDNDGDGPMGSSVDDGFSLRNDRVGTGTRRAPAVSSGLFGDDALFLEEEGVVGVGVGVSVSSSDDEFDHNILLQGTGRPSPTQT